MENKTTMSEAKAAGAEMINAAISKVQAAKGCVRKALSIVGRDICSPVGRKKLIIAADDRIDTLISSDHADVVYGLASMHRSAMACLVYARQVGIIAF